MTARDAKEAQLRLAATRDDIHRDADRLACSSREGLAVRRLADRRRRARDQPVESMLAGAHYDRSQSADRDSALRAYGTRAGDTRTQLGHLDVMRDVLELVSDNVGDEHVDGVASNVNCRKPHLD